MGALRIPGTRKLLGFNIAPKQDHLAAADVYGAMILEWDWDGWIKKQIDFCAGNRLGLNCCRLIGGQMGVLSGLYTQDYYDSKLRQLVEYCQSLGVHFYATGLGKSAYSALASGTTPMATLAATLATTLRMLQGYSNVIGCDVIQEANDGGLLPNDASIITLLGLLRAAGVTLPLTCSTAETNLTSAGTAPWIYAMAANFDYIDIHHYTYPCTQQQFDALRAAYPSQDILMGEFGRAKSAGATRVAPDLRQAMDLANSGDPRIRGGLFWAAVDQSVVSSDQWGVYTSTFTVDNEDLIRLVQRSQYGGCSVIESNRRVA